MIVRYWMTADPITTCPETLVVDAHSVFVREKVRRLPVLVGERMVGILSKSDLYRFVSPDRASDSLTGELESRVATRTVEDVMTRDPATCGPNDPLEEVGETMRRLKVGALPVVQGDRLIGIITESDTLAALAAVAQAGTDSTRLSLRLPVDRSARQDVFAQMVDLARQADVEIRTLLSHLAPDGKYQIITLRVHGEGCQSFTKSLIANDFQVMLVQD